MLAPEEGQPAPNQFTQQQKTASDLADAIKAAPELKYSPGLALGVAQLGGDVADNAQSVMGVAQSKAIEKAIHNVRNGVGPDAAAMQRGEQVMGPNGQMVEGGATTPGQVAPGLLGGVKQVAGAAKRDIGGPIARGVRQAELGAQGINAKGGTAAPNQSSAGPTPGVTELQAGTSQGLSGMGQELAQSASPNQVFQMPSHIYRYLYDVRARRGNGAMIEAALPLIGGMAATYAFTRNPDAAEGVGGAAADAFTADTPTSDEEATLNSEFGKVTPKSAAVGQKAQSVTQTLLKPAVAAVRAPVAAVGAVSSAPELLAGQGATAISGHIIYPDSWQRTMNATTWKLPNGLHGPTLGQTVANNLGQSKGSILYKSISGALDATVAMAVPDVLAAGGRTYAAAKGPEGMTGYLGRYFPGNSPMTPEAIESLYAQSPKLRQTYEALAKLDTPGAVIAAVPAYAQGPFAERLANAKTGLEVKEVFKNAAATQEILTTSAQPSLGLYGRARLALGTSDNSLLQKITKLGAPAPMAYDPELDRYVGKEITANSPEMPHMVYDALKAAGVDETAAQDVATVLATADSQEMAMTAATNAFKLLVQKKMIAYLPNSAIDAIGPDVMKTISDRVDDLMGAPMAGKSGQFGNYVSGGDLSYVEATDENGDTSELAAALWGRQAAKLAMPDVKDVKLLALQISNTLKPSVLNTMHAAGITVDEWLDHTINERIFQPLALATGGWATRVSISEMAQNILRQGPLNFTAAGLSARAAKAGFRISTQAMPHYQAVLQGVLAGIDTSAVKALGKDRILDAALMAVYMHDGHIVPNALDATHTPMFRGTDMSTLMEGNIKARNRRLGIGPKYVEHTKPVADQYTQMAPGNTGYFRSWSEALGMIAHDKMLGEFTAKTYRDELRTAEGFNTKLPGMEGETAPITHGSDVENEATKNTIKKVTAYLDAKPKNELSHMSRNLMRSKSGIAQGLTAHEDWATQAVAALKGTIYGYGDQGVGGMLHEDLLDAMVDKKVPTTMEMASKYGDMKATDLPVHVHGREVNFKTTDVIPQMTNWLHTKMLGPIVNTLSREPTYIVDFANERKLLEPLVASGQMAQIEADTLAESRAVSKMIRFVHNPADRLKIENMLHIVSPFYFAQNQMLRRIGRLFATNPGAVEQYVKGMLALNHMAQTITGQNGLPTVIMPGTTLAGEGMTKLMSGPLHGVFNPIGGVPTVGGIPIGLTGSIDVSTTINPFSAVDTDVSGGGAVPSSLLAALKPALGPIAAIPLKGLQDFSSGRVPILNSATQKILGPIASAEPMWTQGIPNSGLQHLAELVVGRGSEGQTTLTSSYNTVLLSVMQFMAKQNDYGSASQLAATGYPNTSTFKANFIKQANNITSILFMGQMVTAFFSPVSLQLGEAGLQYSDLAQSYINKAHGNINVGLYNLVTQHPDLVPYEVYKTTAANGYAFPEVQSAINFINANKQTVTKYPAASTFLLPANDAKGNFSDSAYQMELAMGMRQKDAPGAFFDELYIASGNAWYFDKLSPKIQAAIKQDPSQSYQIYQNVDKIVKQYGQTTNPIWADYFTQNAGLQKRLQTIHQVGTMLADPTTPKSTQATHLGYLYNLYQQENARYTSGALTITKTKEQWSATLAQFVKQYPDMTTAAQTLFTNAF